MNTLMKRTNGNLPTTPFNGLVDRLFQNDFNRLFDDNLWGFSGINHSVNVPVNLRQTETSYELDLVAPGLKKEDFKVNLVADTLTVAFEHEESKQENGNKEFIMNEYKLQSFTRSFKLDNTIDPGKISAQYTDGILHISLPKKEDAQTVSRTIQIQ